MIAEGELAELKKLTKSIPPSSLVNMKHSGGYTPLIYAIDKERRDVVLWLIEIGADVNQGCKNEIPIQRAIFRNNNLILKDLLDSGAKIDVKMYKTPYDMPLYAIMRGNFGNLETMYESRDHKPIYIEAGENAYPAVKGLVQPFEQKIGEMHAKHSRWRRLREFLKLSKAIGNGFTAD